MGQSVLGWNPPITFCLVLIHCSTVVQRKIAEGGFGFNPKPSLVRIYTDGEGELYLAFVSLYTLL